MLGMAEKESDMVQRGGYNTVVRGRWQEHVDLGVGDEGGGPGRPSLSLSSMSRS